MPIKSNNTKFHNIINKSRSAFNEVRLHISSIFTRFDVDDNLLHGQINIGLSHVTFCFLLNFRPRKQSHTNSNCLFQKEVCRVTDFHIGCSKPKDKVEITHTFYFKEGLIQVSKGIAIIGYLKSMWKYLTHVCSM